MSPLPDDWGDGYVAAFHAERAGITERVLARSHAAGVDPYAWCAAALGSTEGPLVDVACGSGPLAEHLPGWFGLDLSGDELAVAASAGRGPLLQASADQLPLPDGAVGILACSMSLQVLEPLGAVLAEIGRVLRPGGKAVALLPAARPAGLADTLVYLRVQVALRTRIGYPHDELLRPATLAPLAARSGLTLTSDDHRSFALPLRCDADVDELLASFYLPGVARARLNRARRVLRARLGRDLAIPLRRLVLDRAGPA